MGKYVKKICPNCNCVIQNYKSDNTYGMVDIGIPFEICPNCKTILIKKNIKEINMLTSIDYIRIWFWNIISGIILGGLISLFITAIISNILNTNDIDIVFIITFITILTIYFVKCYQAFRKKIDESSNRLKDKEYLKLIEKLKKD